MGRTTSGKPLEVLKIDLDPESEADGHRHVSAIDTSDLDGRVRHWSLVQVIAAVRDGEHFVVTHASTGEVIELEPSVCPLCSMATLTLASEASEPDARSCD